MLLGIQVRLVTPASLEPQEQPVALEQLEVKDLLGRLELQDKLEHLALLDSLDLLEVLVQLDRLETPATQVPQDSLEPQDQLVPLAPPALLAVPDSRDLLAILAILAALVHKVRLVPQV